MAQMSLEDFERFESSAYKYESSCLSSQFTWSVSWAYTQKKNGTITVAQGYKAGDPARKYDTLLFQFPNLMGYETHYMVFDLDEELRMYLRGKKEGKNLPQPHRFHQVHH